MKFKTTCKPKLGFIDLAPLVDILFLLIIFFLLSTSFDFQPGHPVALPREEAPQLVAADKLVVVISPQGDLDGQNPSFNLLFNNQPHKWSQLELALAHVIHERKYSLSKGERAPVLALRADKSVPYEYIMRVIVLSQKLGLHVNLVTSASEDIPENEDSVDEEN